MYISIYTYIYIYVYHQLTHPPVHQQQMPSPNGPRNVAPSMLQLQHSPSEGSLRAAPGRIGSLWIGEFHPGIRGKTMGKP